MLPECHIEVWENHNPEDSHKYPYEVVYIREGESTTLTKCKTLTEAEQTKEEYEKCTNEELCQRLQDKWESEEPERFVKVLLANVQGGVATVKLTLHMVSAEDETRLISRMTLTKPYANLKDYQDIAGRIETDINRKIHEKHQLIKQLFPEYNIEMDLVEFVEQYEGNFRLNEKEEQITPPSIEG